MAIDLRSRSNFCRIHNEQKQHEKMKINKEQWKRIASAISAAIVAFLTALGFSSCGITRATISRPQQGTTTTVTITTNNPMTTTVNPNTEANYNK